MRPRTTRRLDRVKEQIPLSALLASYGYRIYDDPSGTREQQFSCDLHGDGTDKKMSARLYGDSTYCFACNKQRDHLDYVRLKEGLTFIQALRWLEDRYGLEAMPWEDGDVDSIESPPQAVDVDPERGLKRVHTLLMTTTKERVLPLFDTLFFWEDFDRIRFQHKSGTITGSNALSALDSLRLNIMRALQNEY